MPRRAVGIAASLDRYRPKSSEEARDVARVRALAATDDPWARSSPLHLTGSAVILHPASRRLLLRWHERMQRWLHVGGHAETAETSAFDVALREAREETGLADLASWPDPARPLLLHVAVVPVPAGRGEREHEHADLRYLLATSRPQDATAESAAARLRWLPFAEAMAAVGEDNLRVTFERIAKVVDQCVVEAGQRRGC